MRALKTQLQPTLKAPVKAELDDQPEPGPVQIAIDTSDGGVTDDASGGLLGKPAKKSDPELSRFSDAQMPDTPEITASKTPGISVAPPKSTSEQGMKQYLDAAKIRFDRYEDIFAKYKLTQAARFL